MSNNVMQFRKVSGMPMAEPLTGLEFLEIVQAGQSRRAYIADLLGFDTYDLAIEISEGVLNLENSQVFRIDNKAAGVINLSLINPPADRAATVVVVIEGNVGTISWPAGVVWNDDTAPDLGVNISTIVFFWDGVRFIGSAGATN